MTKRRRIVARPTVERWKLAYLQTGDRKPGSCLETWLWAGPGKVAEVKATFFSLRDEYPPRYFEWAERAFGRAR